MGAITKPEMVLAGGADNVLDSDGFLDVDFVEPLPTVDGVKEARDRAELAAEIVGGASGLAGGEDRRDVAGDSGWKYREGEIQGEKERGRESMRELARDLIIHFCYGQLAITNWLKNFLH